MAIHIHIGRGRKRANRDMGVISRVASGAHKVASGIHRINRAIEGGGARDDTNFRAQYHQQQVEHHRQGEYTTQNEQEQRAHREARRAHEEARRAHEVGEPNKGALSSKAEQASSKADRYRYQQRSAP